MNVQGVFSRGSSSSIIFNFIILQTYVAISYSCIIEKECKVETCIIPIDFATQDVYQKITTSLEGLDIGILGKKLYL